MDKRFRYSGAAGHAGLKTHHAEFSCTVIRALGCFQGVLSRGPCSVPSGRKARVRLPRSSITSSESPNAPYKSKLGRRSPRMFANTGQLKR